MLRIILLLLIMLNVFPVNAEDFGQGKSNLPVIKETYKLQGQVEYNDNLIETIYLDENIEIPQVNITKHSLKLPVGVLNITSNSNTNRSALSRATINRNPLKDILPLSSSISEQFGGFSYGQTWDQEVSRFAQIEDTTAFFLRYDSPRLFSVTSSVRQATNRDIGTQYNIFRFAPEWHITKKLTLKDTFNHYMDQTRNKNELTLIYTPGLQKYAESLKFELGVAQMYYRNGQHSSTVQFSTGFKL